MQAPRLAGSLWVASERQWNAHRALALSDQLRSFQTLLPQRPGHGEAA